MSEESNGKPLGSRYLTFEIIGRGAMGTVFRGEVRDTGEPVAVKLLHSELASDPTVVTRFLQERDILTKLDHPNIVRVRDLVIKQDKIAFILELVSGPNARNRLKTEGRISPREAFSIASQICGGLVIAHALGVVHRDIKPENILLDSSTSPTTVKITDFGISRILGMDTLTRATSTLGTPEYMAPELFDAEVPTPAVDIYAVGIMLYELLTGTSPYAGGSPMMVMRRMLQSDPVPIEGLDPKAWHLISQMLSKSPSARPSDIQVLSQDLEGIARKLPQEKLPISQRAADLGVVTASEIRISDIDRNNDLDTATRLSLPRNIASAAPIEKKDKKQLWESEFKKLKFGCEEHAKLAGRQSSEVNHSSTTAFAHPGPRPSNL